MLDIVDGIELDGWVFQVSIKRYPTPGKEDALQGGRIFYFEMLKNEDLVAFYDHKWIVPLDKEDDVSLLAYSLMCEKWNRQIQ